MKRTCGDCTLCCVVMPVREITKRANVRCEYLRGLLSINGGVGCSIYRDRPFGCRTFNCMWLKGADAGARPDQSHLVIDQAPDFVECVDDDTGAVTRVVIIQVWIDPAYPEAHRDPDFRRWLRWTNRPALIRYGGDRAMLLAYQDGEWIEKDTNFSAGREHTPQEISETVKASI